VNEIYSALSVEFVLGKLILYSVIKIRLPEIKKVVWQRGQRLSGACRLPVYAEHRRVLLGRGKIAR